MTHLTQLKLSKSRQNAPILAKFLSNTYVEHQMLWQMAGRAPTDTRDFLYRAEMVDDELSILVLSAAPFTKVPDSWEVRSKEYTPEFFAGQLLEFKLRMSPIVQMASAARGIPADLVMQKYREAEGTVPLATAAQSAAKQWLDSRATNNGFRVVAVEASGYEKRTLVKKRSTFVVPVLDTQGCLEVTDPERFLACACTGLGKGRFGGLGLLLVKPI